ncbi:MAG TPA: glucodextranase DOMON-like domain-containing protein [Steroidobacteraceae bacterium]|nr:glucodextranase DOMON-like domain-containing protein [Steroidobacteraceae bacterium]
MRRSPRFLLATLAVAVQLPGGAPAAAATLFAFEDPRGDDNGSGVLLYPNRDDLKPGDLDLYRFSAEQKPDGIWFAVEMAQPVRSPVGRVTEIGQSPVERLARHGFYTFNVDVYIDTDRIAGSGGTNAIPGRRVAIDRGYAWERCIVLTPRPDVARTMLQMNLDEQFEAELRADQGKVTKDQLRALQARSEQQVAELYYFPDRIKVQGRRVEFMVPVEFLGGTPVESWAYTVVVTGADIEMTGRPGAIGSRKPQMMTMTVARGNRFSQFGIPGTADEGIPPVVDILAPDPDVQVTVLNDYDTVAGRLAAVPGVAPDGKQAVAGTGQPLTMEQAARIDDAASASGSADDGATTGAERRSVPARLRTLNQLLEEGLITQSEYDELRRKILAEL